ncbi:ATP-binding cassette domain-containing protein [Piscinibacter sakaiensis]|uniref:ATP-binding cassette domain-containing protein n=1 Tax=Piscinibacter sakaiensis TaxID=1547922 RepID=UPI003AAAD3FE
MSETILEFRQLAAAGGHLYDTALWQINLRLARGELALVHLESGHLRTPLADAAQGLVEPLEGDVRFFGESWSGMSFSDRLAARSRIGRVFEEPGWISELDMDENITLAQQHHHPDRSLASIRDEAAELARRFSLPGLPLGKPSAMRAPDLRRAACVRAFLGKPELLILERPTTGIHPEIMPALIASVRAARERGAAVLWTTDNPAELHDPAIRATIVCTMTGSQMSSRTAEG